MAKLALLIGSPYGGLEGPLPDVERVARALTPRGFAVRRCVGPDATRQGILDAYRALIADAGTSDAVAVCYSGHGARTIDEDYSPPDEHAPPKRYHHFIVPMDLGDSSEDDFRGILSLELSSLLAQLTAKTRNVSVLFDCCHSGGMTRALTLRPRGLAREWFAGAFAHLQRFTRGQVSGFPLDAVSVEGNPYAVRLVAALPSQQAFEWGEGTDAFGLMTDAFVSALDEAGDRPVTWDAVKRRVREIVQGREPGQYPDVEGPGSRLLFSLEEADLTGTLPIERSPEGPRLRGGRLLGVTEGDEYLVMPSGHLKADPAQALARATVTGVRGATSFVTLDPPAAGARLTDGDQAFPVSRALRRKTVIVKAGALQRSIEEALASSELLRVPAPGESIADTDVLAVVEETGGEVRINEDDGRQLVRPAAANADAVRVVTTNLDRLARARTLETLASGTGASALPEAFTLDWGRVVAGVPKSLGRSGALLFAGDSIFVRVENTAATTLYVSVFDIGLAGKITLLTRNLGPSGVEVEADGPPFTLGYREGLGWKGLGPITWPADVPEDGRPRPESLVVIVSNGPQDLRALESPGMTAKGDAHRSQLERLVDQVATGRTRDLSANDERPEVRYAVEHITFLVDPTPSVVHTTAISASPGATRSVGDEAARAAAGVIVPAIAVPDAAPFLIDERPDPSAAYRKARGAPPPAAVAVQLGEIVVHENRALFSTDVRVDALVVTGAASEDGVYRAGTATFSKIKDGDRLPLDDLLVFHGPAKGFLDIAVWVSRDDQHGLSLADLLKEQLGSSEFKESALLLAGLAVAAPTAGAIVAGIGAAATVSNIAYKVLSAAVGKSIGLYRTSLLATDRFGVGRHPAAGALRAQGCSFWYAVKDVG